MNATEDGMEPLGDYLEAPTFVAIVPPEASPANIPVLGENERQAIAEVRQLATESDDHKWRREIARDFNGRPISSFTVNAADIIAILDKWGV